MADAIVAALRKAEQNQQIIQLISEYTDPIGKFVRLRVVSMSPGGYNFLGKREHDGHVMKYNVNGISEIIDAAGVRHLNDGVRHLSDQAKEFRAWQDSSVKAIASVTSAIDAAATQREFKLLGDVKGSMSDKAIRCYFIEHKNNGRKALIHAKDLTSLYQILQALSDCGDFWRALPYLIKAEFYWPVWMVMQQDAAQKALVARNGEPVIRNDDMGDLYTHRFQQYAAADLMIERDYGMEDGHLHFLEAENVPVFTLFEFAEKFSTASLGLYMASAWPSQFTFNEHPNLTPVDLILLKQSGLIHEHVPGYEELIESVPIQEFRAIIKKAGISMKSSMRAPFVDFFLKNRTPDFETQLRNAYGKQKMLRYVTPAGMDWTVFQHLRRNYRNMFYSLVGWFHQHDYPVASRYFTRFV